jgi:dolichol kinase
MVNSAMVELVFSPLTPMDITLIVVVDALAFASISVSCVLASRGHKKWISRKFTHVAISSLIALALPIYSSLTGPLLAVVIFLVGLFGSSLFGLDVSNLALSAGTRDDGSKVQTFLAAFLALVAFAAVFLSFMSVPFIFVSSILAVSWGDGAGEVVGRPFGRHKFHVWRGRTKSVEGSLAVMIMTFVGISVAFLLFPYSITLEKLLLAAAVVSVAVSAVEVLCVSWIDNVVIPLLSSFLMWFFIFQLL